MGLTLEYLSAFSWQALQEKAAKRRATNYIMTANILDDTNGAWFIALIQGLLLFGTVCRECQTFVRYFGYNALPEKEYFIL